MAPGYEPAALQKFAAKKNLRLLEMPAEAPRRRTRVEENFRRRAGAGAGYARIERSGSESRDANGRPRRLKFARCCSGGKCRKHVKSNAIVFAREGQTVGVGAGQMSRVDSVKIAVIKAATAGLSWREAWSRPTRFSRFPMAWKKQAKREPRP